MQNTLKIIWIVTIIAAGIINTSFAGTYSGGFGTETEPFRIGTVADWQEMMADSNDWDANFIMIADINLQGVSLIPVGNDLNSNNYVAFTGVFDGNGHIISNPAINMPGKWHIGLFGIIDSNGQIRNLGVEDVNMTGGRDTAGLAGYSHGAIINCYATGTVSQPSYLSGVSPNYGGLVGLNRGTISHCHADCDVNNGGGSGGLVGRNEGGTIIDSYATGTVHVPYVPPYGYAPYNNIGGLVGFNTGYYDNNNVRYLGTIARCYAKGSVLSGGNNVGGLVGINDDGDTGFGLCSVTDCYATGTVTGTGYVGGLIGYNHSGGGRPPYSIIAISNCYAAGKVTAKTSNVGGLVSPGSFSTSNCFWDIETTGKTTSGSGTGKTSAEMMTLSTFTSAGWDFVGETANGPNDVWFIREGKEYPRLAWENNKPIADAGPNQIAYAWMDGIAEVTLDASNSYDADGDTLTYLWKWSIDGNTYESYDINLILDLSPGQYTFELVVNDGIADSEPNHVDITVVEPIKSTLCIVPKIINGRSHEQKILAMLRLPAGITRKQIDHRQKLLLYPGEIESSFQLVLPCGQRGVEQYSILAFFDKPDLLDAIGKAGKAQIDIVGNLKTGQYFYGSDTVWIINPPPHQPNWKGWNWGCHKK
jgi:hypothetical protein